MANVADVEQELQRLRKIDLVRIIINRDVPNVINLSESVSRFITVKYNHEYSATTSDISLNNDGKNIKVMSLRCNLKVAKMEVESSKRLVSELERTVGYQQRVIELLDGKSINHPNQTKECAVAISSPKPQIPGDAQSSSKVFSEDEIDPKNHYIPNLDIKSKVNEGRTSMIDKKEVSAAILQTETQSTLNHYIHLTNDTSKQRGTIMEKQGEWQTVHPRKFRKRKNLIIGENTDKIKGVPKFTYLHVCRVDPGTTSQDLTCQLKTVFPEVTCICLASVQNHYKMCTRHFNPRFLQSNRLPSDGIPKIVYRNKKKVKKNTWYCEK